VKAWTVLIFMAADNNLDLFAVKDLHELEHLGSTDEVDVVVQIDRYGDGRTGPASRGRVVKDVNWEKLDIRFVSVLDEIGETNTGDPQVLRSFIEWGAAAFPAERYMLVLWNHGSGWKPEFIYKTAEEVAGARMAAAMRSVDFANHYQDRLRRTLFRRTASKVIEDFLQKSVAPQIEQERRWNLLNAPIRDEEVTEDVVGNTDEDLERLITRAIGLDETSNHDALDCVELHGALAGAAATITTTRGTPFVYDVLGFDACLMAGIEVGYHLRKLAKVMVGSEEIEPPKGWSYDGVLTALAHDPRGITVEAVGRALVDAYVVGMTNYRIRLVTQSALRMDALDELVAALDQAGQKLRAMVQDQYGQIAQAEKRATRFYDDDFLDLGDFLTLLMAAAPDPAFERVKNALIATVLNSKFLFPHPPGQSPTGVSIYFPTKAHYDSAYLALPFAKAAPDFIAAVMRYHFLD
jgi:Clostripain family